MIIILRSKGKSIQYLFIGLLIAYSAMMFILFYRQCIAYQGLYLSDMEAYLLEAQGLESGYDFPYPVMFLVARFFMLLLNAEVAMAFAITVLNAACVFLVKGYFTSYCKSAVLKAQGVWSNRYEFIVILFTFTLFFVSMVYAPRGYGFFGFDYYYRCSGSYTPNPFWNATFLAVRPFTVLSFFMGVRLLDSYEQGMHRTEAILFSVFLLLATMTKPSYTIVVMLAIFVVMVYRFIKAKGKNFKKSIYFGATFFPTIAALLYQYAGVFSGTNSMGEETGIGIGFAQAWSIYSMNIPLSVFMGLAFPLGVLVINFNKLKTTTWYRHAWQVMLAAFLMLLFLYEKGFRFSHMNFSWGYMHGMFFVFMVSVLMLFQNTLEAFKKLETGQQSIKIYAYRMIIACGWLGYIWHLVSGIIYFIYIYQGNNSGFF
ncbi:MAG: hypothetical protein R3Y47_02795 [Lachnospiraceae bacterium]